MQGKYEIVIADTTCFILLENIGEFNLLRSLFTKIITTTTIAEEFGSPLPEWIEIRKPKNISFQNSLDIDAGEASAITLALESQNALLILDDNKGRKTAERLNLLYTGTLGIILKAKNVGIIPSVKPIIQKIQGTNFRFSQKVLEEIYALANE
jgi:predicted nucleic acid-binding protein